MKTRLCLYVAGCLICILFLFTNDGSKMYIKENEQLLKTVPNVEDLVLLTDAVTDPIIFDGLTENELIEKINKSLNSTISNKGEVIVTNALEYGVDPYLATAIMLHETGCKWECSYLVKACNNVGGQVGGPSCNGGSYMAYDTLDEGIEGFIKNLSNNYIKKDLQTVEQIGSKYAASTTWTINVNKYIKEIKNK